MRMAWQSLLAILVLSGATSRASAAAHDNDVAQLMSECGISDLADMAVDSCLERVRVVDETNPSPQLQSLEARLEERKSGKHAGTGHADARPATGQPRSDVSDSAPPGMFDNSVEVPSHPVMGEVDEAAPPPGKDLSSPGAGPSNVDRSGGASESAPGDVPDFGSGHPEPGADVEDEPPIADPPDQAYPSDDPQ
jgi:hypothetical protein